MKRGETRKIAIEALSPDGGGSAVVDGREVLVKGALPGDTVEVRVLSVKRHTARVRLESVIEAGVGRIEPRCSHFDICGGCRWQDVPYDVQCSLKAGIIEAALAKAPGIGAEYGAVDIEPSPDIFFYRNKMEFTIDGPPRLEGRVLIGLHEAGKFDRVFDLDRCLLQSETSNSIVAWTRDFVREHGLSAYGLKSHEGLLRFLAVREGKTTGDTMVNLVTSGEPFPHAREFAEGLAADIPGVTTVLRSVNRSKASVATGGEKDILQGGGAIRETIGGRAFSVSPDSFFQTNSRQTVNLYSCIRDFCGLDGTQSLLDLYCGAGTIGIFLAEGARSVTGVELVENAVEDARRNAALNGATNCDFIAGKVEDVIDGSMGDFDVVVCDPPRAGIHPTAMNHLLRLRIPRLVYVSCNAGALPGDLEMLAMAGYRLKAARAFDMSPHTPHVETVAALEIG
ncbi:MAG: 23S rRNA (uracil(1939)-C(5))-methyltransferase RlmD [Candidatus Latescibacteria bacterium]|nr:23S rRNA (uracil(1939)-C(5))-methyltransferase RlmD [Candidatus Latescibacterota bacterium]